MEAIEVEEDQPASTNPWCRSRSIPYLIILTVGLGGLQGVFCVQFSLGSLHLLSLGITKPVVALIWLSGLVAAVITHPCFGIWSDNIRTPWGRRRPFIVVGTLFAILSLLSFAWIKDIVDGGILFILGDKPPLHTYHLIISICAALCVSCLSIAIQAIQCGIRALIVDKCPLCQQDAASGFASCMVGAGNIISYSLGSVDLSKFFPLGGEAQVKSLSLIVLILLGFTTSLTCIFITEDNTRAYRRCHQLEDSWVLLRCFKLVISAARKLSPLTMQVYMVQFFTWIGWYIFLNYNTVYTREIYLTEIRALNPWEQRRFKESTNHVTQFSSKALSTFAIVSLTVNICLLWVFHLLYPTGDNRTRSFTGDKQSLTKPSMIKILWTMSHLIFAICMFDTLLISHTGHAKTMIAMAGVSWAITAWAPFSLTSMEVSRSRVHPNGLTGSTQGNEAGISMALLSVAIYLPQILAVLASCIGFLAFGNNATKEEDYSIVWLLNFGGLTSLLAAYLTSKIRVNMI